MTSYPRNERILKVLEVNVAAAWMNRRLRKQRPGAACASLRDFKDRKDCVYDIIATPAKT
eukprot:scaffold5930_cov177-Cylindrotheca_fusiformis.AAC.2